MIPAKLYLDILLFNTASELDATLDLDEEMEPEIKTTAPTPIPKRCGRPKGPAQNVIQNTPKPRTIPAKRASSSATKTSRSHKRRRIILDSDEEVDASATDGESSSLSESNDEEVDETEEVSSSLSEPDDDEDEDEEVAVVPKRSAARRKPANPTPVRVPGMRQIPGRNAKKRSETALRSRYFEHSANCIYSIT
jgi:xeroderma pigmentosum group C-complementing protein